MVSCSLNSLRTYCCCPLTRNYNSTTHVKRFFSHVTAHPCSVAERQHPYFGGCLLYNMHKEICVPAWR